MNLELSYKKKRRHSTNRSSSDRDDFPLGHIAHEFNAFCINSGIDTFDCEVIKTSLVLSINVFTTLKKNNFNGFTSNKRQIGNCLVRRPHQFFV